MTSTNQPTKIRDMRDKPTYQKLNPQVQEIEKNQSDFSTQRDREAHLKNVLLAIRDVNQLIARETDTEQLIRKICTSLVKTRGYFNAWIALTDEKGEVVESSAASGFNGGFDIMESALHRGDFPLCMRLCFCTDKLAVTQNPPVDCPDCPLSSEYEGRSGLTCRLSHGDRVFGIISVSVPKKFAYDSEEQDLFSELAADLGHALSKLKTDVQAHHLNQIVTSIPQPISLVSDDYRYLAVNDVYAELFGTAAKNIIGKTPADFFGERFFEKEIKPHLDHVLGGNELQYEIQAEFPGRGNRWMFMSYYPYRNEQGNIAGVISHGQDITERKQAEIALQESEVYYRTLFENVNDAVLVHEIGFDGKPGKFIAANSVALKRLGYTHDELLKLTPKDITTEKGYKELSEARANVISNSAAIFETTHFARNGRPIPVESHVSVVVIAGRRVAVSVVRDLSERKMAEKVLRERVKELTFLQSISRIVQKEDNFGRICQKLVCAMPKAWCYPEIACARIICEGQSYQTENFSETQWCLSADLKVKNKHAGTVEVFYVEERPAREEGPFIKEERDLINSCAERLGNVIERMRGGEENQRFRIISDNAVYGKAIADLQGNLLYVNRFFANIHGYEPEQLIGNIFPCFTARNKWKRRTVSMPP
jgi:PAS domain S-box-containing protein